MIYRSILIKLIADLVEEIAIRLRERRLQREKEEFERQERERLKAHRLKRIKEAKENFGKIDPSKIEV